jgi:hypothetical protein
MRLESRLNRLEKHIGRAGEPCPGDPTTWQFYLPGENDRPVPVDAPRCLRCGEVHACTIRIVCEERSELHKDR